MNYVARTVAVFLLVAPCWLAAADDFPKPHNHGAGADELPLPAEQAAAGFRLPPGFRANVFAAEPDVQNPVAMTWDTRGRLWVAEYYTYADRPTKFDLTLRDRVIILADTDGDGRADERKVFCDNVQQLTSVEVGLGGVWLICLPRLLFIPDRDGDDVPDGPPQVVLDGFETSTENYHNCASGLKWGLDGWLYGRCGSSSPGWIGPPGAARADRVPIHGGIWRYHPTRKVFETLCHGLTNPWGLDWDEHGEMFFTNTVTGHLFHLVPGAHHTRSATISPNARVYDTIDTHADHFHWDTGRGLREHETHDSLGGGAAHCGALIYQADQWPAEYRGKLLTLNLHGRRINVDRLERHGSGYTARHEPDMAMAEDKWFRGVDLTAGPDGSVYVLDWSDTGECHEHEGIHRTSGRVFRISYGDATSGSARQGAPADLTKLSMTDLAILHTQRNEWLVRQARRELANRLAAGGDVLPALEELWKTFERADDVVLKLRVLWTFRTVGTFPEATWAMFLPHADEHIRVWMLRFLTEEWPLDTVQGVVRAKPESIRPQFVARLVALAATDRAPLMQLTLASLLQRLPAEQRPELAAAIASRAEHASDHNIPKLLWYGLTPLVESNAAALVPIAAQGELPLTREWIARALAENAGKHSVALDALLRETTAASEAVRSDIVRGMAAGLAGTRKAEPPAAWAAFQASFESAPAETQEIVRNLNVVFGDGRAIDEVRRVALDNRAKMQQRRLALETLIEAKPDDLREVCENLLRVRFLNTTAVTGLTLFDDREIGERLARSYTSFHPTERSAVITALVARPSFAGALLDQIEAGKIPAADLNASQAGQIRSFGDEQLAARLSAVWGELRDSPADKAELITKLKQQLSGERLAAADARQGRAVFVQTCANCHKLYGAGGAVGPDLTGSGRHNLDYLLGNIVDPSAVVNKDFRMSIIRHADGRVLNGLILSQDEQRVVLQTDKEKFTLPREEIDEIKATTLSPMPDGILQPLAEGQVRDLMAYLMTTGQVELPVGFVTPAAVPTGGER